MILLNHLQQTLLWPAVQCASPVYFLRSHSQETLHKHFLLKTWKVISLGLNDKPFYFWVNQLKTFRNELFFILERKFLNFFLLVFYFLLNQTGLTVQGVDGSVLIFKEHFFIGKYLLPWTFTSYKLLQVVLELFSSKLLI